MPAPSALSVRIRMYRQGLGDCFLLSFTHPGGVYHMLIDCGVLRGTADAADRMRAVVADIKQTTNAQLDLVVATHEHWDHLSGFLQARELWDSITVKQVWLAWTEDPDPSNLVAQQLRESRSQKVAQLHGLIGDTQSALDESSRQGLASILEFFGDPPPPGGKLTTRGALDYITAKPNGNVKYHTPGEPPQRLDGVDGVAVYVLGPPRDTKLLFKDQPSSRQSEVYESNDALTLTDSFFMAVNGMGSLGQSGVDEALCLPFDKHYRVDPGSAQTNPFFVEHYFEGDDGWRRIDGDWFSAASQLALALDSDTNNTSLALAIELLGSGKVLLFPADAQVGNWLSWQSLTWSVPQQNDRTREVTMADLLNRTVFYKVGHHGSHNATLKQFGLELMGRDLVAMMPIDQATAERQGPKDDQGRPRGWNMPFPSLLARLNEKTQGRVIRADEGIPARTVLSEAEWERFTQACAEGPDKLYVEYTIADV